MSNHCEKCNKEFLNLYEGICHQCWSKIKNNSAADQAEEFDTYKCPACERKNPLQRKGQKTCWELPKVQSFYKNPLMHENMNDSGSNLLALS